MRRASTLASGSGVTRVDVSNLLQQAHGHHAAGRLQDAEALYRRIISQDANHPEAWYRLGLIAQQAGHWEGAVNCFRNALQQAPDWPEALNDLGIAQARGGRIQDAMTSFQKAVQVRPDHASAHN